MAIRSLCPFCLQTIEAGRWIDSSDSWKSPREWKELEFPTDCTTGSLFFRHENCGVTFDFTGYQSDKLAQKQVWTADGRFRYGAKTEGSTWPACVREHFRVRGRTGQEWFVYPAEYLAEGVRSIGLIGEKGAGKTCLAVMSHDVTSSSPFWFGRGNPLSPLDHLAEIVGETATNGRPAKAPTIIGNTKNFVIGSSTAIGMLVFIDFAGEDSAAADLRKHDLVVRVVAPRTSLPFAGVEKIRVFSKAREYGLVRPKVNEDRPYAFTEWPDCREFFDAVRKASEEKV